jgi:hypothetical protein
LPAHFAELSAIRGQNQCKKPKNMEYVQIYFIHDDEFGDLYVDLGVDSTESKEKCINLIETIKGLQKYVQSYKVDNEMIMKSKEQQDDFVMELIGKCGHKQISLYPPRSRTKHNKT